jgi:shikimate kinase / 3-dehydroquinate synthase
MAATHAAPPPPVTAVRRVALVGLPGSGKSAVGAALARRLGWRHVDTDARVEHVAGMSVAEVFAGEGEAGFRRRELQALREALGDDSPSVLSCGGGLAAQREAGRLLFDSAWVVWLDAADTVLLRRLGDAADRPLLRDQPSTALQRLRAQRAAAYSRAQLRVDVDDWDVDEVVDAVVDALSGARLDVQPRAADTTAGTSAHRELTVDLGARAYPVTVDCGAESTVETVRAALPPSARRVAVVCDRAVESRGRHIARALRSAGVETGLVRLAGGEPVKTWAHAGRLVTRLAAMGLDRSDCVVAVGGGTVGDLAGFAAASYQRGVAVIQVPTTLLAMVDSAIGGKTGVNLPQGKNLAGAFWQPRAVVCDVETLASVPERDWRAAFAEIVKYSMIAAADLRAALDATLDALLARDPAALVPVIARCCEVKAQVVSDDEREAGLRAILNYGHTVGHALETVTGHGDSLVHGEAVAVGMRVAGLLSVRLRDCPADDVRWQDDVLRRCGLGISPPGLDATRVIQATRADKKSRTGTVRWVLLERLGEASFGHVVPEDAALQALREVQAP